jgi:hypothetical protein
VKPGRRRQRRPAFPRALERGSGLSFSMAAVHFGRRWSGAAGGVLARWRPCGDAPWMQRIDGCSLAPVWAARIPDGLGRAENLRDLGASWRWRRRRDGGHGGDAAGLLQRGSRLCGPSLDPTGPSWDWCASVGALRARCAQPDLRGTGCPAAAFFRLSPSVVEVVPSRVAVVLPASIHAPFHIRLAGLVMVASVKRRWWTLDRSGACWRATSLVVVRFRPRGVPMHRIVRGLWMGFLGRNPCQLDRHRRGGAFGWHRSFLKGVVVT